MHHRLISILYSVRSGQTETGTLHTLHCCMTPFTCEGVQKRGRNAPDDLLMSVFDLHQVVVEATSALPFFLQVSGDLDNL